MELKGYILLPESVRLGDTVIASANAEPRVGNSLPLRSIPVGFVVHNIEIKPGSGGTFARAAGTSAQIMAKEGVHVTLRMPSGEVRMVHQDCWATVGALGNADHKNIVLG